MPHQLTLNLKLRDDAKLDNFLIGPNNQLLAFLHAFINDNTERFCYLWGSEGVRRRLDL